METKMELCVTCGVLLLGRDMCDDCENVASVTCANCGDLTTPYQMYTDGVCERCNHEYHERYESERASLAQWYYNNN